MFFCLKKTPTLLFIKVQPWGMVLQQARSCLRRARTGDGCTYPHKWKTPFKIGNIKTKQYKRFWTKVLYSVGKSGLRTCDFFFFNLISFYWVRENHRQLKGVVGFKGPSQPQFPKSGNSMHFFLFPRSQSFNKNVSLMEYQRLLHTSHGEIG